MKTIRYALVCILMVVSGAARAGFATELVGIRNVRLDPEERLWGLAIQLKEGRIIAVCNIPEGWKITAENYGEAADYKNGGGAVEAGADFGHDAFTATNPPELSGFLLIDHSAVHKKPATLTGWITIVGATENRKVQLQAFNFWRRRADRCPEPHQQGRRTKP